MAVWMAGTPDGRTVVGDARDEAEARQMIEREQSRESVVWNEAQQKWRWTLVADSGKTHHGWEDTKPKAHLAIALAKNPNPVAHRLLSGRLRWEK
ncbi:hypothetical protein [Pseudonocardia xinjiangensis]|uniref:DUF1508 domain-containing protein n=1 Tax=Pseudonocardia xinjiangensis TaxID=75289 RepID=A0ABX1RM07_9PSEU|nr:hypothetical protein [Pseudonocardia xinjiangensis]NMH80509.1 hypothetical protein [Pseudonocardia xinjiangensis]